MARHKEPSINFLLGELLRTRNPRWSETLLAEQVGIFRGSKAQPDLITLDEVPVVVETEFAPARTVEAEATSRLGLVVAESGRMVEHTIACRLPQSLKSTKDPRKDLDEAQVEYCIFALHDQDVQRWPIKGWITGSINDLTDCLEMVRLSEQLIEESTAVLEQAVNESAYVILSDSGENSVVSQKLGDLLNQAPSMQTVRMAMTILANAFTFHMSIQQAHNLPDFQELKNGSSGILPMELLPCWRFILKEINYWPIFDIATKVVECLGTKLSIVIFQKMERAAARLVVIGSTSIHDLSGRMLQRLITDRKFLATFYTLPNSAALLAELSIGRVNANLSNLEATSTLKIADFACGTGTLITAAYQVLLRKFRRKGGIESQLHSALMANGLIAADIMPAATHLTASQLSSTNPAITFDKTCVYTMPYGYQPEETGRPVSLGSLDLTMDEISPSIFGTGSYEILGTQESDSVFNISVPKESLDLVIMNPPFTRPTNHESTTVPIPSFAGFQTSEEEQRAMSDMLKRLRRRMKTSVGDGYAGLASNFIDLAHVKVKPGGVLALVLPLTVLRGSSWKKFRELLINQYEKVTILSIAAIGSTKRAFSADTGMAEVLIVATKNSEEDCETVADCLFVNMLERPRSVLAATETAKAILKLQPTSPYGSIMLGNMRVGHYFRGGLSDAGCAAIRSSDVTRTALTLLSSNIYLPRHSQELNIPIVPLGKLGKAGPVHRSVGQFESLAPTKRGVFQLFQYEGIPTYPVLWSHNSERERKLVVNPDSFGEVRPGNDQEAETLWKTSATQIHLNVDFRLTSQALSACITPSKVIGGRAWPSFVLFKEIYEVPLVLWCNTTLGLISRWWAGARQQEGRSILTVSTLSDYPVLDCRLLSEQQLAACQSIFNEFTKKEFLPANEAYRDSTRQLLDQQMLIDVLGLRSTVLEPLDLLRRQWCTEPSVHGGKSTRISVSESI